MRWGTEQRLEFIEFRLFWEGAVNRSDITARFGVSVPQASGDLSLYRELAPDNITYDASEKRYRPTDVFVPRFLKLNAERYLAQLRAVADGVMEIDDTLFTQMPSLGVMPVPSRRVEPSILKALLAAVKERRSIQIKYQSLSDKRPKPTWREISPHAFGFDGLRWHVRAYCHLDKDFSDFIISRCLEVGKLGTAEVSEERDSRWNTFFEVVLMPNPGLSSDQKRTIELDYGMKGGKCVVKIREALLYYFDKRLRLDVSERHDRPKETPVVVANRAEYDAMLRDVAY
ncbi:MAG: transcriptional regulator [Hyphomicrobium sp.]|nr:transcriptional regulator [Hyphomicrobium sp.]